MLSFKDIACARDEKEKKKIYIMIYHNIIIYYRRYNRDILFETNLQEKKMNVQIFSIALNNKFLRN